MSCHRVRFVGSFAELVGRPFSGDVNALCWRRELRGDFQEVAAALGAGEGITTIDDDDLAALALSPAGDARALCCSPIRRYSGPTASTHRSIASTAV